MPEWLMQLIAAGGAGIGAYAAIRADLARLHEVAHQAREAATEAHRRIDHINERRRGNQ